MIELKKINYNDNSVIDVATIVENLEMLASEIDASRVKRNVIPTGLGTFSIPIEHRGTYDVVPEGHPRLDIRSAYVMLGDNIKNSVKISILINEKKIADVKFAANEKSGKMQIFDLADDIDLGTNYALRVRTSDDRRLVVNVMAASIEKVILNE